MQLDELSDNLPKKVKRVHSFAPMPEVSQQLADIGFIPGEQVTVLRRNIFGGDPIMVRIGLSTFALRKQEAQLIEVEDSLNHD
jgi:ferrous iron transport protein A